MKHYGDIDLQQNYLRQAVLPIDTNFPANPAPGRLVYKDHTVYICVNIDGGVPAWIPLSQQMNTYVHYQTALATTWNVAHGLNMSTPMVQVYDAATGGMLLPSEINMVDNNNLNVVFTSPTNGRAVVMVGQTDGLARQPDSYIHTQTLASTVWTVDHMLGYNPIVRVFIGNYEVQPQSVQHTTINQTVITFPTAQSGIARFV